MYENDEKLINAIKKGDKTAYAVLYRAYYNKLCTYIYSLDEDGKRAEDIVQDVLLKLWVNRADLKIYSSLNAFLYRTAHNAYLDFYRKDKRRYALLRELRIEATIEFEATDNEEKETKLSRLRNIINQLPQKRKEIFILNKFQNFKYKEIAQMRNISERTVESQIRKAMSTIRKAVSKNN
ncbi:MULTISPECIES: RNA polymerase sigma factor [Flavobacteriaceae]|uniref:RNA polymerase sigma factor n=1 Tax=Flavobacteriaceae TaxID=49546 RepID=UPI0014915D68|nr:MULTISPECIES: RNA polymerase sigma-70 factor [Allomuricauda]MDC6367789.1 RNA polymerase sigma-70 factor [Muricauda sp. AC10]